MTRYLLVRFLGERRMTAVKLLTGSCMSRPAEPAMMTDNDVYHRDTLHINIVIIITPPLVNNVMHS
jgi:hypothetical protein